jgi:hypothetical protein
MIKFGTSGWRGIIARDFIFENDPRYFQISVPVQPGKVGVQALVVGAAGDTLKRELQL